MPFLPDDYLERVVIGKPLYPCSINSLPRKLRIKTIEVLSIHQLAPEVSNIGDPVKVQDRRGVARLLLGDANDDEGVRADCGICRSTELNRYGLVVLLSE
jgi:hypothetical protein